MSNSLTALYLQNPELATALRRQESGRALMKEGMDASPIQSPWQGVARLAAALMGGWEAGRGDKEIKEAGDKRQALLTRLMADDDMPSMPAQSAPAAAPAPAMTAPPPGPVARMPMAPPDLAPFIEEQARARGIPPALATSLFATESNFNPMARNPRTGAFGIGQVLSSTAAQPGFGMQPISEADLADPRKAIPWSLDYLKARGGALGVQDFNDPQQAARALRAYGENTDEYERKVLGGAGMMPQAQSAQVAGPGAPPSAPMQPQQGPQDFLAMAQRLQQRAQAAAAAGETALAQQFQNQAVTYRQLALQRQPSENSIIPDPTSPSGYRYVPRAQAAGMPAPAPGPQVAIDQRAPAAYDTERGKVFAARATEWEGSETNAAQRLRTVERFRRALDNVETGFGTQTTITLGQIADRLNVPEATLKALNLTREQTASREQIRSLAANMVMESIGGSLGTGFSNADRDFFERMKPGLLNSKEGNLALLKIEEESAKRSQAVGRAWREWRRTNGDSPDSVRRFEDEKLPGLIAPDGTVQRLIEDSGWRDTGASQRPPQPGDVVDGHRFRGGDPAKPESWERVQ